MIVLDTYSSILTEMGFHVEHINDIKILLMM